LKLNEIVSEPESLNDVPTIGVPLGMLALLFVAGALIFSNAGPDRTRTATNNPDAPGATKSAPGPRTQPFR
jgi:hypothetical protein